MTAHPVEICTGISGLLSVLGTILIFASFFAWPDLRTTARAILVYISMADFITAVSNFIGALLMSHEPRPTNREDDTLCVVQSFLNTASSLVSFNWTVFLAVYLYITLVKRNMPWADSLMFGFHVFSWGLPLIIVSIAAARHHLGRTDVLNSKREGVVTADWCWLNFNSMKNEYEKIFWSLFTGKFWEILSYIIIMQLYLLTWRHLRQQAKIRDQFSTTDEITAVQRANKKMILIPILFILVRIWGTIRYFLYFADDMRVKTGTRSTILACLQGIGDSAQGFTNCIIFCFFTKKIRARLVTAFIKYCPCCKSAITEEPRLINDDQTNTRSKTDSGTRLDIGTRPNLGSGYGEECIVHCGVPRETPVKYNEKSSLLNNSQ